MAWHGYLAYVNDKHTNYKYKANVKNSFSKAD